MTIAPATRRQHAHLAAWAVLAGLIGLVANLLLILFFVLAQPFDGGWSPYGWLGTANDLAVAAQFLTLIPVALALPRWLPAGRAGRVATAAAVIAMVVVVVLQLMLVAGVVDFDLQVWLVTPAFLPVYGWIFVTSAVAHRSNDRHRTVSRFGLLLGSSFPIALVITVAGFGIGSALGLALPFAVPGIVYGAAAWLALPLWPLLLARLVFARPPRPTVENTASAKG